MQRNKLIYAFADTALVVNSDFKKGGTWSGAIEQLNKLKLVPVYVRTGGSSSKGLDALQQAGAMPWPNPQDSDGLDEVFSAVPVAPQIEQEQLFGSSTKLPDHAEPARIQESLETAPQQLAPVPSGEITPPLPASETTASPADEVFAAVRRSISRVLATPKKEAEIADELQVKSVQVKEWLNRLIEEGIVERGPKKSLYQLPGGLI
jgi:predicted Rossmann fold nucleotide-binding protein DprA/Smf involved in DNA uptake